MPLSRSRSVGGRRSCQRAAARASSAPRSDRNDSLCSATGTDHISGDRTDLEVCKRAGHGAAEVIEATPGVASTEVVNLKQDRRVTSIDLGLSGSSGGQETKKEAEQGRHL